MPEGEEVLDGLPGGGAQVGGHEAPRGILEDPVHEDEGDALLPVFGGFGVLLVGALSDEDDAHTLPLLGTADAFADLAAALGFQDEVQAEGGGAAHGSGDHIGVYVHALEKLLH
jgi:hypothetical protein